MNSLTKKIILLCFIVVYALSTQAQVWPVQCASGISCDTHNMLTGFGDGAPANPYGMHEGIDILGSGHGNDKVVAIRDGIVHDIITEVDIDKKSIGDVIIIKVLVGVDTNGNNEYHYDVYNHVKIKTALDISPNDIINAGDQIAEIFSTSSVPNKSEYPDKVRHLHLSTIKNFYTGNRFSGVAPSGANLQNPFLIFNNDNDKDPQNEKPLLENNNDTDVSKGKTVLFEQRGLYSFTKGPFFNATPTQPIQPIFGGVNILAEAFDNMTTTLEYKQGVHAIGYWIENLTGSGASIKNSVDPYMLAKFDNDWFTNTTTSAPSQVAQIYQNAYLGDPTTLDVIPYNSNEDIIGRVVNHYKVTKTKGTNGSIQNVDINQFWKTDAKIGGTSIHDNGSDAMTACINEEAKFKDGKYKVHIVMKDMIHTEDDGNTKVIVDNFLPYIKKLTIKEGTTIIYEASWDWNTSDQTLCWYKPVPTVSSSTGLNPLTFIVEASEPLQTSTVSMTIAGNTFPLTSSSDPIIWEATITPNTSNITTGTYPIIIRGLDEAGHPLFKLDSKKICYTKTDLPKHYVPNDASLNLNYWQIGTNYLDGNSLQDFSTPPNSYSDDNAHELQLAACPNTNELPMINNSSNPLLSAVSFCLGSEWCLSFTADDIDGSISMINVDAPLTLYANTTNYEVCWEPTEEDLGSYLFEVTVFDDCGASTTKLYDIDVECETGSCPQTCPPPPPSITGHKIICSTLNALCGSSNGQINILTDYNGSGSYTYVIESDDGTVISSNYVFPIASSISLGNLSQGDYTIIITDEVTGDQAIENFTITETLRPEINVSGPVLYASCGANVQCLVKAVDITVYGGSGDYTYYWPIGTDCDNNSSSCDQAIINGLVEVVDNVFECTVSVNIPISSNLTPPISFSQGGCSEPEVNINNDVDCQARLSLSTTTLDQPIKATFALEDKNIKDKEQKAAVYISARHGEGKFEEVIFKEEITYNTEYTAEFDPTDWPEGAYTFELVNNSNDPDDYCTNPDPVFGFVPCEDISASITKKNTATCSPCKGSISVTPSGGTGTYNYSWLDCPTCNTRTRQNLCAGTYYIVIADTDDCVRVESITIDSPLSVTYQASNACSGNDGSISLSVTGGSGNYFYAWQDCDNLDCNSSTQSDLEPGEYIVTIFDQETNCYVTQVIEIEAASDPITVSHQVVKKPSCIRLGCNGKVDIGVAGGSGDYSYSWTSCGLMIFGGTCTASSYSNLCKGNYTVTVTDNQTGCTAVEAFQLDCQTFTPFPCYGKLKVQPNPFRNFISLEFAVEKQGKAQQLGDEKETKVSIKLSHISGKPIGTIYEGTVEFGETRKIQYNTSRLAAGKYIAIMYLPCGRALSQTIVKL